MGNRNICQQVTVQNGQISGGIPEDFNLEEKKQTEAKLEPILFDDESKGAKQITFEQEVKMTINKQPEEQQPTREQFREIIEKSVIRASNVQLSKMTVIGAGSTVAPEGITLTQVYAPFKVIRLTATPAFGEVIKSHGRQLMSKYDKSQKLASNWKLHPKGFYYTELSVTCMAIFCTDKYYEGEYQHQQDLVLPNGKGVLLDEKGLYKGDFISGKVHGTGKFIDAKTKVEYEGQWQEGVMAYGTIKNKDMTYQGPFKHGEAEGEGELRIAHQNGLYKGWFRDGTFHGDNQQFECDDYLYCGMFEEGVKTGWGCLVTKEKVVPAVNRFAKKEYYPAEVYDGKWENDVYSGSKKKVWLSQKNASEMKSMKSLVGKTR